jgi:hypothetical protein
MERFAHKSQFRLRPAAHRENEGSILHYQAYHSGIGRSKILQKLQPFQMARAMTGIRAPSGFHL